MNTKDQQILDLQFESIKNTLKLQAEAHTEMHNGIDLKLTQILDQTTKTNGRVNALEKWKSNHELSSERNLLEYNFIKKYPKLMIIFFVAMVILTIINVIK